MTLFFVGEIVSSDLTQRTDKQSGEITQFVSVNVMMRMITKDGKPKVYAEDIMLPIQYRDLIEQSTGKYIVIPYNYVQTKEKAYLFVDDKYQPIVLDSNPFEQVVQKSTKKAA